MEQLIKHPPWCRRVNCSTTGRHASLPLQADNADDLIGIEVTLVQLDAQGLTLVRPDAQPLTLVELSFTEDGVTTTFTVPERQVRTLEGVLNQLVNA
ncbi:hypothetical protein SAMN05421812_102634 [Asanoa hainanensis]|uniref:Uncharacterized protein n=1 Tax=Asanoa hainanensis TaxID=560556 RepID=A0A239IZM0_9ACTN|nr:hypothetical protein [Asanoa hainanensis]SNS98648.1 hypothetical protein SAMN05421812_102634 [Asanoa hainanensis]